MKRRVLAVLLVLAMTAGMLAGCGKKEVDYSVGGNTEGSRENSDGGKDELAEFKSVDTWVDTWTITDENGHERKVTVDAEVIMPEVDKLSVVEVERQLYDEEFRKQFLKTLYENGEVYYHDKAHYIKSDYEKLIANLEANIDEVDVESQGEFRDMIEEYEKAMETAPEDYVVAEDYLSSKHFTGYVGDVLCEVEFRTEKKIVLASPAREDRTYWPEELRDYDEAYIMSPGNTGTTDDMKNSCKFSREEARRLADDFLVRIGRSGQMCVEARDVMWKGENYAGVGNITDYEYTVYGYSFTYGTGVDNMAFTQFPDFVDFDFSWQEGFNSANYNNGDSIEVVVTDEGVTEVYMIDPVNIRKIYDAVDIVSADTVKGIIKDELMTNSERYRFANGSSGGGIAFNSLRLIYMKLPDATQEGVYSFVPIWCASNATTDGELYNHAVFVNAIDGSVVYMDDVYKSDDEGESTEQIVTD